MITPTVSRGVDDKDELLYIKVNKPGLKYGGYKQDHLVQKLSDNEVGTFICNTCSGIIRESYVTKEGKQGCKQCIEDNNFDGAIPLLTQDGIISGLESRCPLKNQGCKWRGKLGELDPHITECKYFNVVCSLNCGAIIPRLQEARHNQLMCPEREIKCQYCDSFIKSKLISDHIRNCEESPTFCSNNCGCVRLKRKDLVDHMENECPLVTINCPYGGCDAKMKRKSLKKHISESMFEHMEIMRKSYDAKDHEEREISLKVACLEKQVESLTTINNNLQQKTLGISVVGNYVWRLKPEEVQCVSQPSEADTGIWSEPFKYCGYTFKAYLHGQLHPINEENELKILVSIFAVKTDLDEMLEWPLSVNIKIAVSSEFYCRIRKAESLWPSLVNEEKSYQFDKPDATSNVSGTCRWEVFLKVFPVALNLHFTIEKPNQ